ncbi:serine/threonine protein kinase [Nostoc sp. FACHB-152]|uniref:serine/threonine-protein kinase n=1 Tax=unclassified Nostoc TaxID=2593658 RepID=UPI0016831F93|nr:MULTISPECIES: serine/threonine-protein kinase [unclassified Nostoc]MBD2448563.1 serine/threonine protein kinase [Nostoc sp. FACHB-152]MBD2469969.1 serine/threonine protein kinase [Nostoc sp. FACHB-145]
MLTKLLGERYQVVQILSQGMFCKTYMAEDTYLPHRPTCVVKHFLPSSDFSIPEEVRRRLFNRETAALQKLGDYDLVPHLLAHFEDEREFYLVQKFIAGHTLSAELQAGYRWSEAKVVQLLQEVLEILNFVHNHGLIHRDVKPSNIMRRQHDHRLVLIDFGAVKPILTQLVKDQKNSLSIDQSTIAIGTPGYMPSEQHRGRPRPNSDIYALGMIAIQALTGVHPTQLSEDRKTGEVVWEHLADVNVNLAVVINKMVRYHFQDRYKSAAEALEALQPFINLYTPIEDSESTLISPFHAQNTLFSDNSYPVFDTTTSVPVNTSTDKLEISEDTKKSPMLIGLVIGVVSGFILMLVSYWSVQLIIFPEPKIQNSLPENSGISY